MKFSIEKKEQYTIFELNEENLNSVMAPLLKSEFIIYRNEGIKNLILDLSNVKFVDSSGLSSILTANRLWKEFGSFVITGIDHPSVKKLIEISRLDTVLEIIPTIQESIDFVMMEELERELKGEAGTDNEMIDKVEGASDTKGGSNDALEAELKGEAETDDTMH